MVDPLGLLAAAAFVFVLALEIFFHFQEVLLRLPWYGFVPALLLIFLVSLLTGIAVLFICIFFWCMYDEFLNEIYMRKYIRKHGPISLAVNSMEKSKYTGNIIYRVNLSVGGNNAVPCRIAVRGKRIMYIVFPEGYKKDKDTYPYLVRALERAVAKNKNGIKIGDIISM